MANPLLLYIASLFLLFWGIAHLFPTRSVVRGFGDITIDNKRILTMEWIIEGVTLIFIAVLVSGVTYLDYTSVISRTVYWIVFFMLNTLSGISLFTGFRVAFLPYKLCPLIFTSASIFILIGGAI
jgi:hypothetical protein